MSTSTLLQTKISQRGKLDSKRKAVLVLVSIIFHHPVLVGLYYFVMQTIFFYKKQHYSLFAT